MSVGDLFYNMFSLGVPRLKFINFGFVCLVSGCCLLGLWFFFRVNFALLIQFITVQCKPCEFGLGEYILQKGEISANVTFKEVTRFQHLLAAAPPSDGKGFCHG